MLCRIASVIGVKVAVSFSLSFFLFKSAIHVQREQWNCVVCWVLLALQKKTKRNVEQKAIILKSKKWRRDNCPLSTHQPLHRFIGRSTLESIEIKHRSVCQMSCILSTNGVHDICFSDEPIVSLGACICLYAYHLGALLVLSKRFACTNCFVCARAHHQIHRFH